MQVTLGGDLSYNEIPCPQCQSNLYFPGTTCSGCGYSEVNGVTPKGLQLVEQRYQHQQSLVNAQPFRAQDNLQHRPVTPSRRTDDQEWLALFDAVYGSCGQAYRGLMYEPAGTSKTPETRLDAGSSNSEATALESTALKNDLRQLRKRSRARVAASTWEPERRKRHPKQKVRRPRPSRYVHVIEPTPSRTKLSRAEYVAINTPRLIGERVDATSLSVVQGFLYDHYDANHRGELSCCRAIRQDLAQFLNALQLAKLHHLSDWDSKLLARFLIKKV